jgi:large subunit ribosomal protein L3
MKCIIGKKIGMTTLYDKDRGALNITLLECVPNTVSLLREVERDGYTAIQLSVPISKKKVAKREFLCESLDPEMKVDTTKDVTQFAQGDKVVIEATTKGKGFQGVVKRHGFKGSPATHGHRHDLRAPGSIGSAYPQHVMKGKRMAGRMGSDKHTTKNIEIVYTDVDKNVLGIKGAVPGIPGGLVKIYT